MSTEELKEVEERLIGIKAQFGYLIEQIQKKELDSDEVKRKYGALKVKLRNDSNVYKTRKGEEAASESESAFYYPAVTEAYLELKVKIDAPPNNKMLECLISGEDYISYYLSQINT